MKLTKSYIRKLIKEVVASGHTSPEVQKKEYKEGSPELEGTPYSYVQIIAGVDPISKKISYKTGQVYAKFKPEAKALRVSIVKKYSTYKNFPGNQIGFQFMEEKDTKYGKSISAAESSQFDPALKDFLRKNLLSEIEQQYEKEDSERKKRDDFEKSLQKYR